MACRKLHPQQWPTKATQEKFAYTKEVEIGMGLLCMNANKQSIKLKTLYGKFLPGLEDEYAYEFTSFKGTERKANDL